MQIELKEILVRDLFDGFSDNEEEGVFGYHGLLNIRPKYQREYIYDTKKRDAVILTMSKNFPLNTMYWVKNQDGTFELLDGQQRTISICKYLNREFSVEFEENIPQYFDGKSELSKRLLDYKLMVYVCDGDEEERLEWFKTINIAGERLSDQELLNINYTGDWLTDAKKRFSKTNCVAYRLADKYVKGSPIRQEFLETALDWISEGNISKYMSVHRNDVNANELWLYFSSVIEWVKATFGEKNYRKEMLGLNWGDMYNRYHTNIYDEKYIEKRVNELMSEEEVTEKKGVYEYILSGEDENIACKLSKRLFSESDKRTVYERQKGICPITGEHLDIKDMQADHIVPWWKGGRTVIDNLQMISKVANARKSGKDK